MFRLSLDQRRWWEFLVTMTEREIKSKYKLSMLGIFWIVLNPLIQMLVIGFIFKFFTPLKTENYLLYLFSGLIVWNFFSSCILRSTPSIVNERYLLKKAKFPRETIILSVVLSNFVQLLISILILGVMIVIVGIKINIFGWLWLPVSLLLLLLFTAGVSLFFSALNVKRRDVGFAVVFLMSIWFYATPVLFTSEMLPQRMSKWLYLNPVTGLLEFFRWILLGWQVQDWTLMLINIFEGVLFCVLGNYVFQKMSLDFDDWV